MNRALLLAALVCLSGAGGCHVAGGCNTCGDCGPAGDCGTGDCGTGDCGHGGCSDCDRCTWLSRCGIFRGCSGCCSEELGCGEMWWGDWFENPPSRCDNCDQCGNWTGPPPYPARGYAPRYQVVAQQGEPTLAERGEYVEQR